MLTGSADNLKLPIHIRYKLPKITSHCYKQLLRWPTAYYYLVKMLSVGLDFFQSIIHHFAQANCVVSDRLVMSAMLVQTIPRMTDQLHSC